MSKKIDYKDSGVDVDAGHNFVCDIKSDIDSTRNKGVIGGIGGFGALFDLSQYDYKNPVLVSATDGVGTKLEISVLANRYDGIGIDLVAMCANDLVVQGAKPLFFLDYFATGKLDLVQGKAIVSSIVNGCKQAGCALIGGETAEMPGVYSNGLYDVAGFCVGIVEKDQLLPRSDLAEGDVIIGIKSSGLHSNGFSLVRKLLVSEGLTIEDYFPFDQNRKVKDVLLQPTRIYVNQCLDLMSRFEIKAFSHITGGGLTDNIPRVLPEEYKAVIDLSKWNLPEIFRWCMKAAHIDVVELLRIFNCGVGMACVLSADQAEKLFSSLTSEEKDDFLEIGYITRREQSLDERVEYI